MEESMNTEVKNADLSEGNGEFLDSQKKLKTVSDYTVIKKEEIDKLSNKFDKGLIGLIRRFWDSKVPKKDRTFYHFVKLTPSNRVNVLAEIEKYQNFYEELGKTVHRVGKPKDRSEEERKDPYSIILALNKDLSDMYEAAKSEKDATASSAIEKIHKSFIEKHEELESMICRVECVVLRECIRRVTDTAEASNKNVDDLSADLKNAVKTFNEMNERTAELIANNLDLSNERKDLLKDKRDLETKQTELQRENDDMRDEIERLLQENLEKREENIILIEKNKDIEREQQKMRQEHEELRQEIQNLKEKNQETMKEREILLPKYQKMQEEIENLLQKNQELEEEKGKLLQKYREMEEEQQNLRQEKQNMMDELKILRQKNKTMAKIQDILLQENAFLNAQLKTRI